MHFWPAGITQILCLYIFYLLYIRFENFLQLERPSKKDILSRISFFYLLIGLIFISALLIHTLTATLFLFSFIWIYLIYFLKDYRRGFDFIFLCSLSVIIFFFYTIGIGTEYFWLIDVVNLSPLVMILGLLGGGGIVGFLIWRYQKSIIFTKGRFRKAILAEKRSLYKTLEEKTFFPIIIITIISVSIVLYIFNQLFFHMDISNLLVMLGDFFIILYSLWGFILFQKKPRGKPLFIWATFFGLAFGGTLIIDIFVGGDFTVWNRIFGLTPAILMIGFLAYIYKLIKFNSINSLNKKIIIMFIVLSSLFSGFFHDFLNIELFEIKNREASTIYLYSEFNSESDVIISPFGWSYVFMFYDYPYENGDPEISANELHYFLKYYLNLFPPENHLDENGTNILQQIKEDYDTDVYIIFEDYYIYYREWEILKELSPQQIAQYYNMDYINKVFNSRTEDGEETPLYWVI
jgi:hypothetical protein